MSIQEAFRHLQYGGTRPVTKGCLNKYSQLSDSELLQWLGRLQIVEKVS